MSLDERFLWVSHLESYPFFHRLLRYEHMGATRTTDLVPSMRDFRRSTVYNELLAPRAARYQANFALQGANHLAIIGIYRNARDFTASEIDTLEIARRPIVAALNYTRQVSATQALLNGPTPLRAELTVRQQEIMSLIALGLTNLQTAHRLGISERTVRKHNEDIFRRLEVDNRVAAAGRWTNEQNRT